MSSTFRIKAAADRPPADGQARRGVPIAAKAPCPRSPQPPRYAADLAHDLHRAIRGEVRFTPGDRALYGFDASVYRQLPVGVVVPRDADDVQAALEICRRYRAPVFGRGCGTGLAGQSVNAAVCFDFSKCMHKILELDPARRLARVQPGVICTTLRETAGRHGLTFGPDPATMDHATLGGMIGNNSCGTHSVMAGKTVDNIDSLDIVTYDGTRTRVGPTSDDELERIIRLGGRRGATYEGLRHIRDTYAEIIRTGMPDIPSAGDGAAWLVETGAIGVEFTSRQVVRNMRGKHILRGETALLPDGEAWLLVEFGGDTQRGANGKAERLKRDLDQRPTAPSHRLFEDPAEQSAVWNIRKHSAGTTRMPVGLGGHPGWPNWEDAAVPPERLGDYLRAYLRLLDRHGYEGVMFGHWGQACVHCRIDFDLRTGTPNRNRIALQMVKDMLDESSFDAGPAHVVPGHVIPGRIGEAVSGIVGKLRDSADAQHHDENNS